MSSIDLIFRYHFFTLYRLVISYCIIVMSRVLSRKKTLNIEVQLLFAQFLQSTNISSHYSLTLVHHLTQFQTTLYPIIDNKIDFSTLQPFTLQNQLEHQASKNTSALLKILFSPSGNEPKLQTTLYERSILPFSQQAHAHKQKNGKRNNKCFLAFPILYRGREIVGQINIKFTFSELEQLSQPNGSRVFASNISKHSAVKQRKKVFSNSNNYFNPCISRGISVVATEEAEIQQDQQKLQSFKNKNNLHHNLQFQAQKIKQTQLAQQNLRNQQSQVQVSTLKLQNLEDVPVKQPQKDISYEIEVPLSNQIVQPAEIPQTSRFQEIPQDYRHLFQKICEINKKYAPLERIPSQQELSEEVSLVHKSQHESFYSLNQQSSQTASNPLAVAEQLLKQLNLYKFGQSLHLQSQGGSEHQ